MLRQKKITRHAIMTSWYSILIFCILVLSSPFLSAKNGYSQELDAKHTYLVLDAKKQTLDNVLSEIEKKVQCRFFMMPVTSISTRRSPFLRKKNLFTGSCSSCPGRPAWNSGRSAAISPSALRQLLPKPEFRVLLLRPMGARLHLSARLLHR